MSQQHAVDDLDSVGSQFYRRALGALNEANLPFLVGGAYALGSHTGIIRRTKDFDIFVMPADVHRALDILARAGYATELIFPHWIGKAHSGEDFIDIIFSSGNGVGVVDQEWFEHAVTGTVLGMELRLCPAEETIWQKAFILERDRCDSADVAHLLRFTAERLDWDRLLRRFGEHWRVLHAHLILFGFIYPSERSLIPPEVMKLLAQNLVAETTGDNGREPVCRGTLLSATQYLRDVEVEGFQDARLKPQGNISEEQLEVWTANFLQKRN